MCSYSTEQYIWDALIEILSTHKFNILCSYLTIIKWACAICEVPTNQNIGRCYIKLVTFNFNHYYWNNNLIMNIIRLTIKALAKHVKGTAGDTNKT